MENGDFVRFTTSPSKTTTSRPAWTTTTLGPLRTGRVRGPTASPGGPEALDAGAIVTVITSSPGPVAAHPCCAVPAAIASANASRHAERGPVIPQARRAPLSCLGGDLRALG